MRRFAPILAALLMLAVTAAIASACPMCKESVGSSDAQSAGGVPAGFNNSIFLMLGGLFVVMGFIAFTVIKAVRTTPTLRGFPVDANPR